MPVVKIHKLGPLVRLMFGKDQPLVIEYSIVDDSLWEDEPHEPSQTATRFQQETLVGLSQTNPATIQKTASGLQAIQTHWPGTPGQTDVKSSDVTPASGSSGVETSSTQAYGYLRVWVNSSAFTNQHTNDLKSTTQKEKQSKRSSTVTQQKLLKQQQQQQRKELAAIRAAQKQTKREADQKHKQEQSQLKAQRLAQKAEQARQQQEKRLLKQQRKKEITRLIKQVKQDKLRQLALLEQLHQQRKLEEQKNQQQQQQPTDDGDHSINPATLECSLLTPTKTTNETSLHVETKTPEIQKNQLNVSSNPVLPKKRGRKPGSKNKKTKLREALEQAQQQQQQQQLLEPGQMGMPSTTEQVSCSSEEGHDNASDFSSSVKTLPEPKTVSSSVTPLRPPPKKRGRKPKVVQLHTEHTEHTGPTQHDPNTMDWGDFQSPQLTTLFDLSHFETTQDSLSMSVQVD